MGYVSDRSHSKVTSTTKNFFHKTKHQTTSIPSKKFRSRENFLSILARVLDHNSKAKIGFSLSTCIEWPNTPILTILMKRDFPPFVWRLCKKAHIPNPKIWTQNLFHHVQNLIIPHKIQKRSIVIQQCWTIVFKFWMLFSQRKMHTMFETDF